MSRNQWPEWRAEFESLGATAVRKATSSGRWHHEKTAAARLWLQQEDAGRWQPGDSTAKDRSWKGRARWLKYVFAGFAILYGLAKLFRIMAN